MGHLAMGCALSYADFRFADLGWRDEPPGPRQPGTPGYAARPSVLATEIVDA